MQLIKKIQNELVKMPMSAQIAEQEAWWIVEALTLHDKVTLIMQIDCAISEEQESKLEEWIIARVRDKKPIQYILGMVPFLDLEIIVKPPILIPRPETEEWVAWLCKKLSVVQTKHLRILDLCTGSGCIALALARALPHADIVAADISQEACALAMQNKVRNNIQNITIIQSDLCSSIDLSQPFDLIVSNPPYISENEYKNLEPDVRLWEDFAALVAGGNGLALYKRIADCAQTYICYSRELADAAIPQIVVELGTDAEGVKKIFSNALSGDIEIYKDAFGVSRWLGVYLTEKFV